MEKFIEAVAAIHKNRVTTSIGKVKEIKGNSCTVERSDLAPLLDVRLNAIVMDLESSFTVMPAIGSTVLVIEIEGSPEETAVIQFTQIDSLQIKMKEFEFLADKDGLKISNQGENLMSILSDLITELNKILVIQGNNINVPEMNTIRNRFKKVLK
jgi:hypothetical protein